jgi:hypothetical protein
MTQITVSRTTDQLKEPLVPLWGDLYVPRAFTADIEDESQKAHLTLTIEMEDARPRCRRLDIDVSNDLEITGDFLRRIAVGRWLLEALLVAVEKPSGLDDPQGDLAADLRAQGVTEIFRLPSDDERQSFREEYASKTRRPRRGSPISQEHLAEVAKRYREAAEKGDHPTQAVAREMNVARSTAARWVGLARRHGLLGPSLPGRAGEATTEKESPE